ncbi:MAG TPA: O-antigen ligase family protein [Anaerolineae bacterium]|nr:O-antigen ligase family protein [Anaerolineae bacterium]
MNGVWQRYGVVGWCLALPGFLFGGVGSWWREGLALWGLGWLLVVMVGVVRRGWPRTWLNGPLAIYLLWVGQGWWLSPYPADSWPKLLVHLGGVVGLGVWVEVIRGGDVAERQAWLGRILAVAGSGVTVVALLAMRWPEREVIPLGNWGEIIPHLTGSFYIHHNEVAGTLLPLLPISYFGWRWARGRGERWLMGGVLLVHGMGLLVTQSRNAWLGVLVVVGASWVWGRRPRRWGLVVVGLVVVGLVGVVMWPSGREWLSGQMIVWDNLTKHGSSPTGSWDTRLEIWEAGWQLWPIYSWVGSGLYTFESVSWRYYPYVLIGPEFEMGHAHNLWLQTVVTLGVPGLVSLVWLWGVVVGRVWAEGDESWVRAWGLGVIGYLSFNWLDMLSLGQKPAILIWLILAGLVSGEDGDGEKTWANRQIFIGVMVVLLWVGLGVSQWGERNWRQHLLDQWLWAGGEIPGWVVAGEELEPRYQGWVGYGLDDEEMMVTVWARDDEGGWLVQNQGQMAERVDGLAAGIVWYSRGIEVEPTLASLYFWRGLAYEKLAMYEEAWADYERAARLTQEQNWAIAWQARTRYSWGRMLLHHGEEERGVMVLEEVVAMEPLAFYYQGLGDAWLAVGDEDAAERAYQKADQLR